MAIGGLQIRFQIGLFGSQFFEIGVGIGVGGVHFVQSRQRSLDRLDGFLDVAAHILGRDRVAAPGSGSRF
jgi:hypothetical protein